MEWCRASARVEAANGEVRTWESGLDDAADHVQHLEALIATMRRERPSIAADADVRVLMSVQRGGGGPCALTIPADAMADLVALGADLWVDAYQETSEDGAAP